MRIVIGLALLAALTTATAAKADPCKAIPDRGPMPPYLHRGAHFSGPVVYGTRPVKTAVRLRGPEVRVAASSREEGR